MSQKKEPSKKNQTSARKNARKKNNLPLILAAVAVVCAAVGALLFGGGSGGRDGAAAGVAAIAQGEYLSIPLDSVSGKASFYPIEVDGREMEVLAVRASDGTVRTAFNTCQSCYDSGKGYYVQEGDELVCQNCGFHFTPDEVEIQSGGCNPWPIFPENKTVTQDEIRISYDFLSQSAYIFDNWKA